MTETKENESVPESKCFEGISSKTLQNSVTKLSKHPLLKKLAQDRQKKQSKCVLDFTATSEMHEDSSLRVINMNYKSRTQNNHLTSKTFNGGDDETDRLVGLKAVDLYGR